uniref:Uncharacterized protein n=1 Tax=Arundo donax TaxID=35708 RepID=A0A0A9G8R5_ARUDO
MIKHQQGTCNKLVLKEPKILLHKCKPDSILLRSSGENSIWQPEYQHN